jgi:NAD(P)-dependent dehydrogenase (short-subunit alcohol dehydrogenase family)
VILAVRSQDSGNEAKAKIEAATGRKNVAEVWPLDLSSHSSVKAFAKRACEELERIDGVVENAGVALDRWTLAEGMEMTLAVNVMNTFLLAILLLPKMKETAKKTGEKSHLSIVSSETGFWMKNVLEPAEGNIIQAVNTQGRFVVSNQGYASLSRLS